MRRYLHRSDGPEAWNFKERSWMTNKSPGKPGPLPTTGVVTKPSPSGLPGAPKDGIGVLVSLLEKQRALYGRLCELSRDQAQLIETAQTEPLLELLGHRQKLIDEVTVVNADLEPYRRRWAELWADLGAADRGRVGALVRAVEDSLAEILKRDEEDRKALQTAKAKVSEQIKAVSHAGAAVNAYRSGAKPGAGTPAGVAQGNNRFMNHQG